MDEPSAKALEELLKSQKEALEKVKSLRGQLKDDVPAQIEKQIREVLQEAQKYEAEIRRILSQMKDIDNRVGRMKSTVDGLEQKKKAESDAVRRGEEKLKAQEDN